MPKTKGEKFKVIELDSEEAAILLSLMRQAPHEDANAEVALEIIETLEALGTPLSGDEEEKLRAYEFPEESPVIISVAAHLYLPILFKKMNPTGVILKQYIRIKKAINNADKLFDKQLIDAGWNREDGRWFPPEDGPILPDDSAQPEKSSPAKSESEAPVEEPAGISG